MPRQPQRLGDVRRGERRTIAAAHEAVHRVRSSERDEIGDGFLVAAAVVLGRQHEFNAKPFGDVAEAVWLRARREKKDTPHRGDRGEHSVTASGRSCKLAPA